MHKLTSFRSRQVINVSNFIQNNTTLTRIALFVFLGSTSVLWAFLLLGFLPLYPDLVLRPDKGGILGIPHFAENPAAKGALETWPFNEYAILDPVEANRGFRMEVEIGDYILLQLSDGQGNKTALRASVIPEIPSALIRYVGDRVVFISPLSLPTPSRDIPHRLSGWFDGRQVHWHLDQTNLGVVPFATPTAQWLIVGGLKGSRIIRYGTGMSTPVEMKTDPWLYKKILLLPLAALLFAFLFLAAPTGKKISVLVFTAAAALCTLYLLRPSIFMILVFLGLSAGSVLYLFIGWGLFLIRRRSRSLPPGIAFRKLVQTGIVLLVFACFFGLPDYLSNRSASHIRVVEPKVQCSPPATMEAAEKSSNLKKIVIYGSSTAAGEGLADPTAERFGGILQRWLTDKAVVEVKASGGATLNGILETEKSTAGRADLVILYSTFNDAMFSNGNLLTTLAGGRVFDLYKFSYDASDYIAANYRNYQPAFEQKVRRFIENAKVSGAQVLMVGELCADQVLYRRSAHAITRFYRSMKKIAAEEKCEFLDLSSGFFSLRDDVLFIDAMHLNETGHCHLAAALLPTVNRLLANREPTP